MAWEDGYRDHNIWSHILATSVKLTDTEHDEESASDFLQLQSLLSYAAGFSSTPNPTITQAHLEHAESIVLEIQGILPSAPDQIFAYNGNQLSLFSRLAQTVRTWPAPGGVRLSGLGRRAEAAERALVAVNERTSSKLAELEDLIAKVQDGLQTAVEAHNAQVSDLASATIADIDQKVSDLQVELGRVNRGAAKAEATTEAQKSRLDEALSSHQEKFSEMQGKRAEGWSELLSDSRTELDQHMARMNAHEEQSRNVLAAVGVNATASDFESYAIAQAQIANRWRIGAVLAFSIAAAFFLFTAGMSFFGLGGTPQWWEVVFQKVGAPLGAAAVGYFLQRESAQHRKQEREAKQVQLTLTALEPFISNLPATQQEAIRMDTAREIFTGRRESRDSSGVKKQAAEAPGAVAV